MKPNLLLIHGALGASTDFNHLLPLLRADYEVKAMDLPGHGGTSIPKEGFTTEIFTRAVHDFIETEFQGLEPVFVFGYSMGGYVALLSAMETDSRIAGILTLATKMNWDPAIAAKETAMLNPGLMLQKIPQFAAELEKKHAPVDWRMLLSATAGFMQLLGETNPLNLEVCANLHVMCRFMLGDRDKMVSLEETVNAYKAIPGASLSVLPNTTHPLEKADPERLAYEIHRFFT